MWIAISLVLGHASLILAPASPHLIHCLPTFPLRTIRISTAVAHATHTAKHGVPEKYHNLWLLIKGNLSSTVHCSIVGWPDVKTKNGPCMCFDKISLLKEKVIQQQIQATWWNHTLCHGDWWNQLCSERALVLCWRETIPQKVQWTRSDMHLCWGVHQKRV